MFFEESDLAPVFRAGCKLLGFERLQSLAQNLKGTFNFGNQVS